MKATIYFHECEHNSDLENYLNDLKDSGADILSSNLDYEEETAEVKIEVAAYGIF